MAANGVRRAGRRDVAAVVALWGELMHHHAPLDPQYRMADGAEEIWREGIARRLREPDAGVFVQERDAAVCGFVIAEVARMEPVLRETARAEITDLYVRPAARRRGTGRALVEAALGWVGAQGVERVEVRVVAGNVEGQAFWRALGFADFVDVLHRRL